MFEIGFQEIVVIALLALIVLGPEKLPKLAAKLGRWTGRARSMARNLRQQLESEISYEELLKQKQEAEAALRKATEAPMNFHAELDREVAATLDEAEGKPAAPGTTAEPHQIAATPPPAAITDQPDPAKPAKDAASTSA